MKIIRELPPHLNNNVYVAIDTEWHQINSATLHRPTSGKFACMTLCYDPEVVYLIDDEKLVPEALERIKDAVWIIHHAKFDITHLRRLAPIPPRKKLVDTMLMERILWNGYFTTFGLDDLARRYLSVYLDKSMQEKFGSSSRLSPEQVQYACMDASITLQVWNVQKTFIKKSDMYIWKHVDLPALWAIMEFEGFTIDIDRWLQQARYNAERADELAKAFPVNPNSPAQMKNLLISRGFKGLQGTGSGHLSRAIQKYPQTEAAELAKMLLDYRGASKLASTYGENFVKKYVETRKDGSHFIHCDYWVIGAETGRTSSDKPNMQNQPNEESFRSCFIPRPGNVLIDCDYAQQEVGIAAYMSGDKKMMKMFNSGQDIYISMAKEMYGVNISKQDPLRKRMKAIVLGIDYGMSQYGLAKRENISVEEAEKILHKFKKAFPEMSRWMENQMKKTSCTYTILGRRTWLNPYSSQCPRNALNNPIQGSAGDQLKQSIARITEELLPIIRKHGEGGIVAIPHDEIVLDCPIEIAEEIATKMAMIMVETANKMCPGMNFAVEYKIGTSWAEK